MWTDPLDRDYDMSIDKFQTRIVEEIDTANHRVALEMEGYRTSVFATRW
jgi:hypothetical protein